MTAAIATGVAALIDRYDAVLLDAYGVLVTQSGPLPGAAELCAELHRRGRRFFVVTNDASRLPDTSGRRLRGFGLDIADDDIITAGSLLAPWFARHQLAGAACLVLGTDDSRTYVARAGGRVLPADPDTEYDVIAVCDDAGFPFLETTEIAMTVLFRSLDRGRPPRLVLPNPDLIYPKGSGECGHSGQLQGWGFTAGAIALLLEAALTRRFGPTAPTFERLGKPHPPIFEEAARRAGSRNLVMIGDQLETDIAGARGFGIDAALLTTGVSRWDPATDPAIAPTYLLDSLLP